MWFVLLVFVGGLILVCDGCGVICVRCLLRGFTEVGFGGLSAVVLLVLDVCFLWLPCCFLPWFMVFNLPVCCF